MDWWIIVLAVWLAPGIIVGALLFWHVNRDGSSRPRRHARNRPDLPPAE